MTMRIMVAEEKSIILNGPENFAASFALNAFRPDQSFRK